jgi:hypothetical protein
MQAADQLRNEPDLCFCFIGGGSEFSRIQKWAGTNPRVLCLPYQPLAQLSSSLSAADAQVVVMGDAMLGLVHPCKIYNILMVGAPVIYIGPEPSHVTEVLAPLKPRYPWVDCRHGSVAKLVREMRQLQQTCPPRHGHAMTTHASFSQAALLPRLVALIESLNRKPARLHAIKAGAQPS